MLALFDTLPSRSLAQVDLTEHGLLLLLEHFFVLFFRLHLRAQELLEVDPIESTEHAKLELIESLICSDNFVKVCAKQLVKHFDRFIVATLGGS